MKNIRCVRAILLLFFAMHFSHYFCDRRTFSASKWFTFGHLSNKLSKERHHDSENLLTMDLYIWNSFTGLGLCTDQNNYLTMNQTDRKHYWFPYIEEIKKEGLIIISNVNCGYIHFALNFWKHYQKIGYDNIVFIAEDCVTYSFLVTALGQHHVAPPLLKNGGKEAQIYGSKGFGELASMRPVYMHFFLNRGVSIIWQDLDSVPLEDPMRFIPRGFDAVLIDDKRTDHHYSSNYLCSCFIYMNPSSGSLTTLELWFDELNNESVNQLAFNRAISNARAGQTITIAILPRSVFPNGEDYDKFNRTSAWIHANYRKGAKCKQQFLSERGAWAMPENSLVNC